MIERVVGTIVQVGRRGAQSSLESSRTRAERFLLHAFTRLAEVDLMRRIPGRVDDAGAFEIGGAESGMKRFGNAVQSAGYAQSGNPLEPRKGSLRYEGE